MEYLKAMESITGQMEAAIKGTLVMELDTGMESGKIKIKRIMAVMKLIKNMDLESILGKINGFIREIS